MYNDKILIVPYGTIGYLKTDKDIRECRCVRISLHIDDSGKIVRQHQWKVAGIPELFVYEDCFNETPIGCIYTSEYEAQVGINSSCSSVGKVKPIKAIYTNTLLSIINKKYGIAENNYDPNHKFSVYTYANFTDNSVRKVSTHYEVVIDENGIDCIIPLIDSGKRYVTEKSALKARKQPLPVHKLKDDEREKIIAMLLNSTCKDFTYIMFKSGNFSVGEYVVEYSTEKIMDAIKFATDKGMNVSVEIRNLSDHYIHVHYDYDTCIIKTIRDDSEDWISYFKLDKIDISKLNF